VQQVKHGIATSGGVVVRRQVDGNVAVGWVGRVIVFQRRTVDDDLDYVATRLGLAGNSEGSEQDNH